MKERISALVDGELDERAAAQAIDALKQEGEALDSWRSYHLISDAMRDTRLLSEGFAARVAQKLAAEPTVLAPNRLAPAAAPRWLAMPAAVAASLAGIALVGWLALAPQPQAPAPVAQAPAVPQVASVPHPAGAPVMVPLPSATSDYLLAHQGFSPRLSLQGVAPYVRTVSDQENEGRK
jgi:sigma-E factor negative regulatory protein RseA